MCPVSITCNIGTKAKHAGVFTYHVFAEGVGLAEGERLENIAGSNTRLTI